MNDEKPIKVYTYYYAKTKSKVGVRVIRVNKVVMTYYTPIFRSFIEETRVDDLKNRISESMIVAKQYLKKAQILKNDKT